MGDLLNPDGSWKPGAITDIKTYLNGKYKNSGGDIDKAISSLKSRSFNQSSGSSTADVGKDLGIGFDVGGAVRGLLKNAIDVSMAGFYDRLSGASGQITNTTLKTILNTISEGVTSFNPLTFIKGMTDGVSTILKDAAENNDKLIEKVFVSGGQVGRLGEIMVSELGDAMATARAMGMTVDDFLASMKTMMESSGRMVLTNREFIGSAVQASVAFTRSSTTLTDNVETFRNVGLGLTDAAEAIESIGKRSASLGLNAKNTSETIIKQMDKLNQFGFKDGIQGLGRMVQEAQALNYNIENTTRLGEQLFDPTKAIDLAANMQVLGGAVGDLRDPLKLLYDSTNNMEGLQTSILDAAKGLATYNAEQGRFEVSGANLRRAKAMADALGMSMNELTNSAVKAAVKTQALSEINMFPGLNDEQKEFMANLSQIKKGEVGFAIPKDIADQLQIDKSKIDNGFVKMSDLSVDQVKQLQEIQQNIADTDTKDLARQQFNATTQIYNVVNAMYLRMQLETRRSEVGMDAIKKTYEAAARLQKVSPGSQSTMQMMEMQLGMSEGELTEKLKKLPGGEALLRKMTAAKPESITAPSQTEQARKEAEKTTTGNQTIDFNHNHVITLRAPDVLQGLSRDLLKDPALGEKMMNFSISPQEGSRSFLKVPQ